MQRSVAEPHHFDNFYPLDDYLLKLIHFDAALALASASAGNKICFTCVATPV
jgi:hypothetical protein